MNLTIFFIRIIAWVSVNTIVYLSASWHVGLAVSVLSLYAEYTYFITQRIINKQKDQMEELIKIKKQIWRGM